MTPTTMLERIRVFTATDKYPDVEFSTDRVSDTISLILEYCDVTPRDTSIQPTRS